MKQKNRGIGDINKANAVLQIIAEYFNVNPEEVKSRNRYIAPSHARQIVCYIMHKYLKFTMQEIGEYFSNRHRSTIIYSYTVIMNDINGRIKNKKTMDCIELFLKYNDLETI